MNARERLILKLSQQIGMLKFTYPFTLGNRADTICVGVCSGTFISKNYFLTAAHCLDISAIPIPPENPLASLQHSIHVEDLVKFLSVSHGSKKDIKVLGASEVNRDLDYAILHLEQDPSDFSSIFVIGNGIKTGEELLIMQYPFGDAIQWDWGIHTYTKQELTESSSPFTAIYYEDIQTEKGSSGSGIFNRNGELVGIHLEGKCLTNSLQQPYGFNSGVSIQDLVSKSGILNALSLIIRKAKSSNN